MYRAKDRERETPMMVRVDFVLKPYESENDLRAHEKAVSIGEYIKSLMGDTSGFDAEAERVMEHGKIEENKWEVEIVFNKVIQGKDGLDARKKVIDILKLVNDTHQISRIMSIIVSGIRYGDEQSFDDLLDGDFFDTVL